MKLPYLKIALISSALVVGYAAYFISNQPDSIFEQFSEFVLRIHGINVDFSPDE